MHAKMRKSRKFMELTEVEFTSLFFGSNWRYGHKKSKIFVSGKNGRNFGGVSKLEFRGDDGSKVRKSPCAEITFSKSFTETKG